ncbi:MAG: hypothetical protein LAQ69_41990 [Acidobacteriia bacterium]|nr:hypothetical protein [Terriglobia bacterium]
MAAFYWSIGQVVGGSQTMILTIVGEVIDLQVTSRPELGNQPVPFQGFQACIPTQNVTCGPVPLTWLPLTANGYLCAGAGQTTSSMLPVPSATSQSPTDPNPNGPSPFCDAQTHGGIFYTTPTGGGSATNPPDPCDAAQKSPALSAARSYYEYACGLLRSDQANVTVYTGIAAAAQAAAIGFTAAAAASGILWYVAAVFAVIAMIFGAIALLFSLLAAQASIDLGLDETRLDLAQKAWESAIAAVRTACCPALITISTADLVCP